MRTVYHLVDDDRRQWIRVGRTTSALRNAYLYMEPKELDRLKKFLVERIGDRLRLLEEVPTGYEAVHE